MKQKRNALTNIKNLTDYNKFISGLELKDIYLKQAQMKYVSEDIDSSKTMTAIPSMTATYKNISPNNCICFVTYKLTIQKENHAKKYVYIEAIFKVNYKVKSPMNDTFFKVFKDINLTLNTWPYFREFVHNTSSRMGLPPLIAPTYKVFPPPK